LINTSKENDMEVCIYCGKPRPEARNASCCGENHWEEEVDTLDAAPQPPVPCPKCAELEALDSVSLNVRQMRRIADLTAKLATAEELAKFRMDLCEERYKQLVAAEEALEKIKEKLDVGSAAGAYLAEQEAMVWIHPDGTEYSNADVRFDGIDTTGWKTRSLAPRIPAGMCLVPREPTREMEFAADHFANEMADHPKGFWYWSGIYRAMVNAAQKGQP
jgi:hypothetical protein